MENLQNGSNASTPTPDPSTFSLSPGGLIGYYLFFIVLIMIPVLVANVLILIALIVDQTTSIIVRLMLSNIPVACLVVSAGELLYDFAGLGLAYTDVGLPDNIIELCRTVTFLIGVGSAARMLFLVAFSVTVYVIVRFNVTCANRTKKWVIGYFVVAVAVLWALVLVGRMPLFFDVVISNSCRYTTLGGAINTGINFLLYGVSGFAIAVTFLALTVCYIQRNTISNQDISFKKAMLKFAAFLLIGNLINSVGLFLPPLIGVTISAKNETSSLMRQIAYYCGSILIDLSLIPTPILLLAYFKPVRMRLKMWLCCYCLKGK